MAALDLEPFLISFLTSVLTGAGIAVGVYLASRAFIVEIKKEVPKWIKEISTELQKERTIQHALSGRKQ